MAPRDVDEIGVGELLLFIALASFAEYWTVEISGSSSMSLSFTVNLAACILFGPAAAALIGVSGLLITDGIIRRHPVTRVAFNLAMTSTTILLAGMTYLLLGGSSELSLAQDALPLAAASLVYLCINNTLVSLVLALTGRSFGQEWLDSARDILLPYVSMGPMGALVAYSYVSTPWAIVYFIPLVLVIYNGFRLYVTLQHETDHALVALADSIDKRDQYTYQHSMRVARLSGEIAESIGLSARDIDLLVAASRVHDLGKIATDNRVLFKQSSLTPEERRLIQAHSAEGGELAGRFSMFREGRRFIRHHHERWDGKGYPDGIAGEDIPLGARIIAVADSYDAMTSDRPYRKALPHEVAMIELRRGAGSQFDPAVVDAFLARESARHRAAFQLTTEVSQPC
jgi:putative nucleotidyltransferase with HDIG domain